AFGSMLLLNALLISRAGDGVASLRTLRLSALVVVLAAPIYVGTHSVAVAFAGIAVWGASTAWLITPRDTLLQRATPVEAHGRILAIDAAVRSWAHVISLPLAAFLLGAVGVRTTAFVFALIPLVGVWATRRVAAPTAEAGAMGPAVAA